MHHLPASPAPAAEAAQRSPRGVLALAREHPVATDRVLTAVRARQAVGGELEAGPGPHGGYRVAARLPLDGTA